MIDTPRFVLHTVALAACSAPTLCQLHAASVENFAWERSDVSMYGKAEASFELSSTYDNPYDPDEISVDALISGPHGESYEMPCFWYQPVTWSEVEIGEFADFNPPGEGVWMLRFSPESAGRWEIRIRCSDEDETELGAAHAIDVAYSDAPGFVRLDPEDRQGFRFDNGAPYLPIGINLSWNDHSLTPFYDEYLSSFSANGMNWMRHWFVAFSRQALEWSEDYWSNTYHGVGRYSQEAAALTDMMLEKASLHGVYVQIALEQHGKFSTTVDSTWADNPYNEAKGGWIPSDEVKEFFTDAQAIKAIQNKYRYIVARWGFSRNVFAWELFNEANWIEQFDSSFDSVLGQWHKTMSSYLKEIDPYQHLVTTSAAREELEYFADHPDIDILQEHLYATDIDQQVAQLDDQMLEHFSKPALVGEFGIYGSNLSYGSADEPTHPDLWGDHVRQSAWIGTMKRVPNMFWYWSEYLRPYDLFPLFKPISAFWAGEDPGAQPNIAATSLELSGAQESALAELTAYALQSDVSVYGYLYDESYGEWAETGPTLSNVTVTVPNLKAGAYHLSFTDPVSGAVTSSEPITILETADYPIALPDFSKDIAFKLTAPPRLYSQWVADHFSESEILNGQAAPDADPAGDGVANLLKFALGVDDPTSRMDSGMLPKLEALPDGTSRYRFATPGGDVAYIVESSSNLQNWQNVSEISIPRGEEQIIALPSSQLQPALFLRLQIRRK
ncbi:DUF5060 domain-containing protein [Pelagicoccus sp. SDUM812003]|uniref:DUF5060 domain-containing protein n=1 Tax=Pelagicoccus sp. SDUM812003 TaxID=3041267 RepID=UPI00280D6C9C|nr:DUF5060 domain-containing protein [Pelagicoccus sp. SDUM812003]MDQ8204902.1 DUF5060 domain-containing protein [Pelagicoccus sp. SDUM812003]